MSQGRDSTGAARPGEARPRPSQPAAAPKAILCPYCGHVSADTGRCGSCRGFFDPLSRQATQNAMGPWFIRDPANPFRPGCSFDTLRMLVERKRIGLDTVIRGPATHQFWSFAKRTPSVANLFGLCHNCGGPARPDDDGCAACGARFRHDWDRQHIGLTPIRLLPGDAPPDVVAASSGLEGLIPGSAVGAGSESAGATGPSRRPPMLVIWILAAGVIVALLAAVAFFAMRGPEPAARTPGVSESPAPPRAGVETQEAAPAAPSTRPPVENAEPEERGGNSERDTNNDVAGKVRDLLKAGDAASLGEAERLAPAAGARAEALAAAARRLAIQHDLRRLP